MVKVQLLNFKSDACVNMGVSFANTTTIFTSEDADRQESAVSCLEWSFRSSPISDPILNVNTPC